MRGIAIDEDDNPVLLVVVSETVIEFVGIFVSDDDVSVIDPVSELVEESGDGVAAVVGGGVSGTASVAAGGAM